MHATTDDHAARLLRQYLAKWEPLRKLLGLKGAPVLTDEALTYHGQSSVNDLPVDTTAGVGPLHYQGHVPNLVITIKSRLLPTIVNRLEIPSYIDSYLYPERLGLLCTIWMEHYRRALVEMAVERKHDERG